MGRWDLAEWFAQSSLGHCRGGLSINQDLFGFFKIQAPFLVKPCAWVPLPAHLQSWDDRSLWDTMWLRGPEGGVQSWIRPGGVPDPALGQGTRRSRAAGEPGGSRLAWLWLELALCSPPALSPRATSLRQPQVLPGSPGADRRGLLWILDEEVLIPGSGDSAAFDRLCSYFATKGPNQEGKSGSARPPVLWHRHLALGIQETLQQIEYLPGLFFSGGAGARPQGTAACEGASRRCTSRSPTSWARTPCATT